jgi:hypothetical protein
VTPDDIILGCYELARYYRCDPRVFLEQPISQVARHRHWTTKLEADIRERQAAEAPE